MSKRFLTAVASIAMVVLCLALLSAAGCKDNEGWGFGGKKEAEVTPPPPPPVKTEEPAPPPVKTEEPTPPPVKKEEPIPPPVKTEEPTPPPVKTEEPTPPPVKKEEPTPPPVKKEEPPAVKTETAAKAWEFRDKLPPNWIIQEGVVLKEDTDAGGILVETVQKSVTYQLYTEPFALPAGKYDVILEGEVKAGGLFFGVEDIKKASWIVNKTFDVPGEGAPRPAKLTLTITLEAETSVGLRLGNSQTDNPTRWLIKRIAVVQVQ